MRIAVAALALVSSWILLLLRVGPVPTWFFVFAWYPTLVVLDGIACRLTGSRSMFSQPAFALTAFAWSAVIWLVFEAANFRLGNWYYVFLPARAWERWAGILLSFATVLPAIVLAERVCAGAGLFRSGRGRAIRISVRDLRVSVVAGIGTTLLALALPQTFFPLIWGSLFFATDPIAYHGARHLSLLGDLERGHWGRIGRLMVGGLAVGLVWEAYNYWADGSWIYTVPWLEQLKLFEMPPLGFLGFPFFALEAWSMYGALCALGLAVSPGDPLLPRTVRPRRAALAGVAAVVFTVGVLAGMERFTISSVTPELADLPATSAAARALIETAGITSPRDLARISADNLTARTSLDRETARSAIASAQLVTLRGIGARHARRLGVLGVQSVCGLAAWPPDTLWLAYDAGAARRPTPAEVRVWTRAATRRCREGAASSSPVTP